MALLAEYFKILNVHYKLTYAQICIKLLLHVSVIVSLLQEVCSCVSYSYELLNYKIQYCDVLR